MLGATLRVKSPVADLCRANTSVSTLVLDINGWFIEAMFIEIRAIGSALRQEGNVCAQLRKNELREETLPS